jgi:hypothetical protein
MEVSMLSTSSPARLHVARRIGSSALVSVAMLASLTVSAPIAAAKSPQPDPGECSLGPNGAVKHVIYIQFDNTHLRVDRPGVPSDLQQMPHLLDFMRDNGTLLSNDHTILISHTAGGILSSLTGVYPDQHGQTVSNSYVRTSSTGAFSFPSSFGYWTDPVSATNTPTVPNMITPTGANAPAPWVPYTRAGCDFGAVATANTVLENTGTGPNGDITKVFGNPSPQATEAMLSAAAPPNTAARAKAQTDFVGFAIHCAQGSTTCANGQNDQLPTSRVGTPGSRACSARRRSTPCGRRRRVTGLDGSSIVDPSASPDSGFDGMFASASPAYSAEMQEAGVPSPTRTSRTRMTSTARRGGPHRVRPGLGRLRCPARVAYDDAFAAFFQRLDRRHRQVEHAVRVHRREGDHFVGSEPANLTATA